MNQYTKALYERIVGEAIQEADEMSGGITEASEYIELMAALSAECMRRAAVAAENQKSEAQRHADAYEQFQAEVQKADAPCKYGHFGCSTVEGGRCSDEYHASLSSAARAIVDGE